MARSLNLCQFIGHIGKAPEISYMPNGKAVTKFSIACADDYKDKQGNKVEQTNWIRCVSFDRIAEIIGEYCRQGSKIYVSGKQTTREWTDDQNVKRYSTEIVVSDMQMLDSKDDSKPQSAPSQPAREPAPAQNQAESDAMFDDIPF